MPLVTQDKVRSIWKAHGLGRVGRVTPAVGGVRNECYLVDERWVIRFNTRDPQWPKFANERIACDLLRESGLPVPAVLLLDESRSLVPYDYVICTRLPGANACESRAGLSADQVRDLAWHAGRCLAQIHGHTFPGFGKLRALDDDPFSSWAGYVRDYVGRYLEPALQQGLVGEGAAARLRALLDRACDRFAHLTRGALVHCDYHYENILQAGGQLTGLLDFEWALSGDPSYDFCVAPVRERMLPGSEGAFVAGYSSLRAFDPWHEEKVAAYRAFLALETAVTDQRWGNARGVRAALADLARRLGEAG